MRRILAFFIVFSVFSAAFADNIDNFLGIKFGSNKEKVVSKLENLGFYEDQTTFETDKEFILYFKPLRNFSYIGEKVTFVAAIFENGKFVSGAVSYIDIENFEYEHLIAKFPDLEMIDKEESNKEVIFIFKDTKTFNLLRLKLAVLEGGHSLVTLMFDYTE